MSDMSFLRVSREYAPYWLPMNTLYYYSLQLIGNTYNRHNKDRWRDMKEELSLIVEDLWQNFEQYKKADIASIIEEAYELGKSE